MNKKKTISKKNQYNYLTALNSANTVLSQNTYDIPFQGFIDIIGSHSSADRAYIFLNHTGAAGEILMSHMSEWCVKNLKSNRENADLQNISYKRFFPSWYKLLSHGEIISKKIENFPRKEKVILEKRDVQFISLVPIIFGDDFIGFTGLDYTDLKNRRIDKDLEFLKAATYNLSHRIEQDWVLSRLKSENNLFKSVMDAIDIIIYAVDPDTFEIIYMNKFAVSKLGDSVGLKCWKSFKSEQHAPCSFCSIQNLIAEDGTFKPPHIQEHYFKKIDQWYMMSTQALKWPDGRVVIFQMLTDITQHKIEESLLQRSIEEKESLLGEVHHRVKNNLQSLIYLISMQSDYVENPHAVEILKELQERIKAMALVHTQLYNSKNLAKIKIDSYISELLNTLLKALSYEHIAPHVEVPAITLDIKAAIPVGLIINELVTNIIKHAFKRCEKQDLHPEIKISFNENPDTYTLSVSDNGAGFTMHPEYMKYTSMGLKLVTIWSTHQLGGTLNINEDDGVEFIITFPKER